MAQQDKNKTQKLSQVPAEQRLVVRRTAVAAGLSRYLVSAMLKEGRLHRSTRIKPALTTENKHMRVEHVLSYIDDAIHNFEPMENVIHIDEKWFNQDTNTRTYMLLEGELPPQRDRKSKNFIPKTMFLAAVARPRYDFHRKCRWSGKIGIWALTEDSEATPFSFKKTMPSPIFRHSTPTFWPLGWKEAGQFGSSSSPRILPI
ncbi:hypothetical protein PPTG_10626 [Phytophthora nicotianae INRA-310]|uniref:Transposase Tc1-like domain-containing protein n=1 Tax=Phytophthora nicotianae (strain INRA-310) TaxID=761204 RepID=W2QD95_PHYN3|nr:hypothetical protein PPTG_10626 [Phytophthora nicotianae INRA-310]ETN10499.1 hypothetical protein PPTG_10626 [Phytophthora nicotianae INRA-310]